MEFQDTNATSVYTKYELSESTMYKQSFNFRLCTISDDELRKMMRRDLHHALQRYRAFRSKELFRLLINEMIFYWNKKQMQYLCPLMIRVDRKRGRHHVGA